MTSRRVASRLVIVGLGPAGLERLAADTRRLVQDPGRTVVIRTLEHPAAAQLAGLRTVVSCDDLYDDAPDFEVLYGRIVERVLAEISRRPVVYAVPGSALVGERSSWLVRRRALQEGLDVTVIPGESFLDLAFDRVGVDPITDGLQVVDGRELPDPFPLHLPTFITQVDHPGIVADVTTKLQAFLPPEHEVTLLERLGAPDEAVRRLPLSELARTPGEERTSLFVAPAGVGWLGLVDTVRRLRKECPWDRRQTHHSLRTHLLEEAYETIDAIEGLSETAPAGPADYGAYAILEEELGDLLLQVVLHATLAREAAAFDLDEVAEGIARKLVRRHPHVFGDVEAETAEDVIVNWERLKAREKRRTSLMDDVATALPALVRAEKLQRRAGSVGFDWPTLDGVLAKVDEELAELTNDLDDRERAAHEVGDLLFAIVNLSRHLGIDAELALRSASDRFAERFRHVEGLASRSERPMTEMDLDELDALWEEAKRLVGPGSELADPPGTSQPA